MERPKPNLHIKSRNGNTAEHHAEISKAAGHRLAQVWVLVGSLAHARCHREAVLLPPGARRCIHWVFHCAVMREINSTGVARRILHHAPSHSVHMIWDSSWCCISLTTLKPNLRKKVKKPSPKQNPRSLC